jgi:cardiolipin synthase (CMP-forming)
MASTSTKATPAKSESHGLALAHLLNIPNFLTLLRIFSIPIFLALLTKHHYDYALYIFLAAAVTDAIDGTVARWFDSKTEIGAFLDPFADKLLLLSAFVVLTFEDAFPGWLLGVVVIRDLVIVFGYFMLSFFTDERVPVKPSYLGKASTCFQLLCVIAALEHFDKYSATHWETLLYLTCAVTALSGVHYVYRGLVWLRSREPEMFV